MKICYDAKTLSSAVLDVIQTANDIITEYHRKGYGLTLRQLYYQFVARGLLPNDDRQYKRLGKIISDGRLAGEIDWNAIEDRTRYLRALSHWDTPGDIINGAAYSYRNAHWPTQDRRVEVWIEKDSLIEILQRPCDKWDVPYFSCRGYTSQSAMRTAAMRFVNDHRDNPHKTQGVVIHLGDHDPSGIDMTRDIKDRMALFCAHHGVPVPQVKRVALNMDQINEFNPPPNPAKLSDSRARDYIVKYGPESWELDALDVEVMSALVEDEITPLVNMDAWDRSKAIQEEGKDLLLKTASEWTVVSKFVQDLED